jgi:rRNA processing protein Krr1/Pno1
LLQTVTGRTADFLVAADGSRVAGISLIENTLTRKAILTTRPETTDQAAMQRAQQYVRAFRLGFGVGSQSPPSGHP